MSASGLPDQSASACFARRAGADAQAAGHELQERPALNRRQRVEPAFKKPRRVELAGPGQPLGDLAERGGAVGAAPARPDERDGFGQVPDIIVGEREKLFIHPRRGERVQERGLCGWEGKLARKGGERGAAVGVGRGREIGLERGELAVARGRQDEPVEELGERAHGHDMAGRGADCTSPSVAALLI
jgi:hypothetical protein